MSITSNTPETVTLVKEDTANKNTFRVTLNLDNPTITTTTNGTVQLTSDNYINNVSLVTNVVPASQTKTVTITENGTTAITPDNNIPYLDSVIVNTNVPYKFIDRMYLNVDSSSTYYVINPQEHDIVEISSTATQIVPDSYTYVNNVAIVKIVSQKSYTVNANASHNTTFVRMYGADLQGFEIGNREYVTTYLFSGYLYIIRDAANIRFQPTSTPPLFTVGLQGTSSEQDTFLINENLLTDEFKSFYFPSN